jgi:hypothetical protein
MFRAHPVECPLSRSSGKYRKGDRKTQTVLFSAKLLEFLLLQFLMLQAHLNMEPSGSVERGFYSKTEIGGRIFAHENTCVRHTTS